MSAYDYIIARKTQDISSGGVSDALHNTFYIRSHIIQSIQTRLSKPSEIYTESTVIVIGYLFVTEVRYQKVSVIQITTIRRLILLKSGA
jgi:hypothetical protein